MWSIEDLHSLWLKAKSRHDKRHNYLWNLIREAGETLPCDKKEKQVYYYDKNNKLCKFNLCYISEYNSWSFSWDSVKLDSRDEKLSYWIADEKNFEFGQKISEAYKFTSGRLVGIVYTVMVDEINKVLNSKFKELKTIPPKSFTIILGGIEYIILTDTDRGFGYSYNKFSLISPKTIISL